MERLNVLNQCYVESAHWEVRCLFCTDAGWPFCPSVLRVPAAGLSGASGLLAWWLTWRPEPCQEEALLGLERCRGQARWGISQAAVKMFCNMACGSRMHRTSLVNVFLTFCHEVTECYFMSRVLVYIWCVCERDGNIMYNQVCFEVMGQFKQLV